MANILNNRNITLKPNQTLALDCTQLGKNGFLMVAICIATRTVVGHHFSTAKHTQQDTIDLLRRVMLVRGFIGDIEIVHTDLGGEFKGELITAFLKENNIIISDTQGTKNGNPVVEKFNGNFKRLIRQKYNPSWTSRKRKLEDPLEKPVEATELGLFVKQVIEEYNATVHLATGETPNMLEDALVEVGKNTKLPSIYATEGSELGEYVKQIKAQVVDEHKQNIIVKLLFKIYQQNQENTGRTLNAIQESADQIKAKLEGQISKMEQEALLAENRYVSEVEQRLKMQRQIEILTKEIEDKAERKEKRRNAIKQPLREIITPAQFEALIAITEGHGANKQMQKARRVVAFFLLWLTGLRVANLLLLTVRHVNELIAKGETTISLIKRGDQRFGLQLPRNQRAFFQRCKAELDILMQGKEGNQPLFTANDPNKAMNVDNFTEDLNVLLREISKVEGTHIRTHSFRATAITEMLAQAVPLKDVAAVIGHKSIMSSDAYDRNPQTEALKKKNIAKRIILSRAPVQTSKIKQAIITERKKKRIFLREMRKAGKKDPSKKE
jgi:site-specific recombinase XerD